MRERNAIQAAYARTKGKRYAETFRCPGGAARLRRCGSPTCYWLFLDETKNCSRRWCEMASCGNLMKVRRHRANQHRSA
jgi:predicted RNA-binding Zn ribbon-like protein